MVRAKNSCHKWLSCMLGMPTVRTLVGFLPPCCVGLCPPRIWFGKSFPGMFGVGEHVHSHCTPRKLLWPNLPWNRTRLKLYQNVFFLPHGFFQLRVEGVKQKRDNSLCPATESVLVQTMSVYACVPFSCANYLPHKQAAYRPASLTCMAWPA